MRKPARVKPDLTWIRARQALLTQVKAEVQSRLGDESDDVRAYRMRYESEFRRSWKLSSKSELIGEIERADLVYGADFHALGQSQRTHLKILRDLQVTDRPVTLALECFGVNVQKWLDLYISGAISLEELRKRSRWEKSWGFPWENYRPLLELAKKKGFQLLALNEPVGSRHHASLEVRERNASLRIRDAYLRNPASLLYILFGDLHLAETHLPKLVRDQFRAGFQLRDLIVHLNSERIYFQLARKGLELSTDVVKLGRNRYCVMSSPPWVQWQSYLLYLERADDSDLDRGDEASAEDFDPTDQVAGLIQLAARDLGLEKFKLDDLSVYPGDDNLIWQQLERRLKRSELECARGLLAAGRSFFVPSSGSGFLARATINHAAGLAGQYVHAKLSGRKRLLWNMPTDFPALIWVEAVAYFFSKLINHKRQSETLTDLKAQLALAGPAEQGREAMRLALDRFMSELVWIKQGRRRALQVRPRRKASYLEAARILGGMMGERLYLAHRSRALSEREIVQFLRCDVTAKGFTKDYEQILRGIGPLQASATPSKRERL